MSRPSAATANVRQDRIGRPSMMTVQQPQTPCSHPTWVPVSPRSTRIVSDKQLAGRDFNRGCLAVDRQLDPYVASSVIDVTPRLSVARDHGPHSDASSASTDQNPGQVFAVVGGGVDVTGRVDPWRHEVVDQPLVDLGSGPSAEHSARSITRGVGATEMKAALAAVIAPAASRSTAVATPQTA